MQINDQQCVSKEVHENHIWFDPVVGVNHCDGLVKPIRPGVKDVFYKIDESKEASMFWFGLAMGIMFVAGFFVGVLI